jgi:hypothetical protein
MQQHDGAIASGERFRQQFHHLPVDACLLQVDEGHLQVLRQEIVQRGFGHEPQIGEHASELSPRAPLFGERRLQLLFGDGSVLDQHFAEPDSALDAHLIRYPELVRAFAHFRVDPRGLVDFLGADLRPLLVGVDHDRPQ